MTSYGSSVLAALNERDRHRLLDRAVPKVLQPGEVLYLAGDETRRTHIVVRGLLKLLARDGEGNETILALVVEGELAGDIAAADGLGQPLEAVAAVETHLLSIDSDLLVDAISRDPAAALEFARALARRTRWVCETALERTSGGVDARLAGRLLDLADLIGRMRAGGTIELELPLAQADLGRLAGMCRESACKTLRSFKRSGVLDYEGRRLRILRPDALHRIRCAGRGATPFR